MRSYSICSLSSQATILTVDAEGRPEEFPFDCFSLSQSRRHLLDHLLGMKIDCTISRQASQPPKLRYLNFECFEKCIKNGSAQINRKELEDSKIYTPEQKNALFAIQPELTAPILDLTAKDKNGELLKRFSQPRSVSAILQYFAELVVIRFTEETETILLPIRLANVETYFQCVNEAVFGQFIADHRQIEVKLAKCHYNAENRCFEVRGELPIEVETGIISMGWGVMRRKIVNNTLFRAEEVARSDRAGIFKHSPQILGFIYAKNNFVGVVNDILDGYNFEIIKKGESKQELVKIELPLIICPVGDEAGSFESYEFARKNLIGQRVHVYLKKSTGLNITGSVIRISDSKDMESWILENGWGTVRQEYQNSILAFRYNEIMKKAKEKQKGIFGKHTKIMHFNDLTQNNRKKDNSFISRQMEILKDVAVNEAAIMQGLCDEKGLTYRVMVPRLSIIIKVRLEGVTGRVLNPLLKEEKEIAADLRTYIDLNVKKRDLQVVINDYSSEENSFQGSIFLSVNKQKVYLQQLLLEQGYIYCDNPADEKFVKAERKARDANLHVFQKKLIQFQPFLERNMEEFVGTFSWIEGFAVYIQMSNNEKTLENIWSVLNEQKEKLVAVPEKDLVIGAIVVAPYQGDLYRGQVLSVKQSKVKVHFIDWGNKETVSTEDIFSLPESLLYFEPQVIKSKLNLIKPCKSRYSNQILEAIRAELMEWSYTFRMVYNGEYVNVYRNEDFVNRELLEKGLAKRGDMVAGKEMVKIKRIQEELRSKKIGIWEYSDVEDDLEGENLEEELL